MKIVRAYKTELDPTRTQLVLLRQHGGAARYTYNWGLEQRKAEYEATGKSSRSMEQHKKLNALKKTEFQWMYEVSKCAMQEALRDLGRAYDNFYRRMKKGVDKLGFPKFKCKHRGQDSFRLTGAIHVKNGSVKLPRLGEIRLKEKGYLPTEGVKILSATCSERAGRWFVSVQVEQWIGDPINNVDGDVVGIDLGVKTLAVCSNGMVFENSRALKKSEKQLRAANKSLHRKKKGSENRKKAVRKVARVHYRVSNVRKDSIHKATSEVVRTKPRVIVLEDLNVRGMVKNRKLSKCVSDAGFGEFKRQVVYKSRWSGVEVVFAPRFYPSSKLCSVCGLINEDLTLEEREWDCPCGAHHDRDFNASINLMNFSTGSFSGIQACGEGVRPLGNYLRSRNLTAEVL